MRSRLPSRRFRDTQWLIIAALTLLLAMVLVEMNGMLALARAVEEEASKGAAAAAEVYALTIVSEREKGAAPEPRDNVGIATIRDGQVVGRVGLAGPPAPTWWPWGSRGEWEQSGRRVTGPVRLAGGQVVVAYRTVGEHDAVRVVLGITSAGVVGRWRWAGASLAAVVALGGGLLTILLIGRVLAPYRDLLTEAQKVAPGPGDLSEDRFLVDTFRETVQRLERSEAAVRQRADELAVLADVLTREAGSGVIVTDPAGVITARNPAARTLVGELAAPGAALPAALRLDGNDVSWGERILEIRHFPLRGEAGQERGEVVFLTDRTSWVAMEKSLREREQMANLGELAAGMTHELRNALATISGYLRLLPDASAEQIARYLAAMDSETRGVGELLDRFLSFAQPKELRRQRASVLALAGECAARVRASCPGVELALSGEAGEASVDPMAIMVVLENLMRNAAEAVLPGGGRVEVRVEGHTSAVSVSVADDGPGVDPEVAARMFQPFVSSKPSGGMGLALARRFARLHGGDVEYFARDGGGACFVVRIPVGERS
jgi:signal transduction histidine kinase